MTATVDVLAQAFKDAGTPFIVGHPGGESVELMEAARQRQMRFLLMKQEVAGAMLAATWGDITGSPGICMSTRGPGAANMVNGVKAGFERKLDIVGIGYRAQMQGKATIQLALGYSHPVIFPLPDGVTAEIDKQVAITLRGADKALLGQTAAKLRALRKPDPYKGKGVKYADEVIRRKVGKKAGAK